MGLCALPHSFFATIWWRSHFEILAAFYATRYGATWLGWGYERPLALVVAAVYLFLRGSAFPETKGKISSCLLFVFHFESLVLHFTKVCLSNPKDVQLWFQQGIQVSCCCGHTENLSCTD